MSDYKDLIRKMERLKKQHTKRNAWDGVTLTDQQLAHRMDLLLQAGPEAMNEMPVQLQNRLKQHMKAFQARLKTRKLLE